MLNRQNKLVGMAGLLMLLVAAGCQSQGLQNGDLSKVQIHSTEKRAGNVYLIRGLIGVFSTGMDQVAEQLRAQGIRAHVYQDAQNGVLANQIASVYKGKNNVREPLILIGHSYGADGVVRVARKLDKEGIPVDMLITIDATIPPNVPKNVKVVYNYYQSTATDFIPMFRGIPLTPEKGANVKIVNIDIKKQRTDLLEPNTNHINIDKNVKVQKVLVNHVAEICPPRQTWLAQRGLLTPTSQPTFNARSNTVQNTANVRTVN